MKSKKKMLAKDVLIPKVSVIIPVYNVEKYLRECLDSVVNQTLKEIEIILIDDGSTDNSLKICREYEEKDSRVRVYTQKNQGQSEARNNGLKHLKAPYVAFIDSDDYVHHSLLLIYITLDMVVFFANVMFRKVCYIFKAYSNLKTIWT